MPEIALHEYRMVPIDELKEHPQNPRIHPNSAVDKITKSIEHFGFTSPILASKDGYILAGHARKKASIKAGAKEVPVIFLPLEGEDALAYLITDNRIQEETEWDMPVLKDLLQEIDTGAFDLELTGFDMPEIENLMTQFHVEEFDDTETEESPEDFEEYDEDIETEHRCPKCGYEWSGKSK